MKSISLFICLVFCTALFSNCQNKVDNQEQSAPTINIIFDTDMGNDIDDALALDMLYKYMDSKRMKVLAIMNNKDSQFSTEFLDIMNTWYGYPNIPIGKIQNGVTVNDYKNYAQDVCKLNDNGQPLFKRTLSQYENLIDSHILYRKILAEQPDSSVTVISVGFSTNIARLLETTGDEYSPLSGKELVAKKVKLLSLMAGSFKENPRKEFNIIHDIPSAQKLFTEWPGRIVVSPFEVGAKVQFPGKTIENDFNWGINNPLVEAYKHYRPMPYDRATWDLTSVLYVAESDSSFFKESELGKINITDDGITAFEVQKDGPHSYLAVDSIQALRVRDYFIRLVTQKPQYIKDKLANDR